MKYRKSKIIMAVAFLLFDVTIVLTILLSGIDKKTWFTTTLYTATVTDVDITDTGKNISAEIHTKEYHAGLYISKRVAKGIIDDVKNLENGQTIYFRIENSKVQQIDEAESVDIVSLETNKKAILSLEKYNECIYNLVHPAKIAVTAMSVLFIAIATICYQHIKKSAKR